MSQSSGHRRSIRLRGYDYSLAGLYFLTLCAQDRRCLFGDVVDGVVRLNALGEIVAREWMHTADIRPEMKLDAYVIMPNHLHGLVRIIDPVGAYDGASPHAPNDPAGPSVAGARPCARKRTRKRARKRADGCHAGARPCAPTSSTAIAGIVCRRIQICHHKTDQCGTGYARTPGMATQLLGSHHSQRSRWGSNPGIHPTQSVQVD